jgi:hypothetical protein
MCVNNSANSDLVGLTLKLLPGPDRKRTPNVYTYRVTYRNPQPGAIGCSMTWDVHGGRLVYQVALERTEAAKLRWHCTCADAVYRSDDDPQHICKHVQGLIECLPSDNKQSA